jgi:hypothetical protein
MTTNFYKLVRASFNISLDFVTQIDNHNSAMGLTWRSCVKKIERARLKID